MDISHKVPKGLFEHTGLWHGVTLGQMFVLAAALMLVFITIMALGGTTIARAIFGFLFLALIYSVMRFSNLKRRGALKEATLYIIKSPFEPKRYSG